MAGRRILIVVGHPDPAGGRLVHALVDAYAEGARQAGHAVRRADVARLDFPLLRTRADWEHGPVPPSLAPAQRDILWAQHLVLAFPLWMGDMPALLKAFIEQVARPGLAGAASADGSMPPKALRGRSARIVVTMGMPALAYRWFFRAHSVKSLERNILGLLGVAPVHATLIGGVAQFAAADVDRWRARLRRLGAEAA